MQYLSRSAKALARATMLAAGLGFAAPALAQNESPETDLPTGAPVEEGSEVGQSYIQETFQDWQIRCLRAPEGQPEPCQMYQLLKDPNGTEVAEFTIFYLGEQNVQAAGTVITPLETLLPPQLTLTVDGQNGRRYPYSFCNRIGCYARMGLTSADVDLFKRGAAASVGIVPAARPDKPVDLSVSLSGFTAAYERVTEINTAAAATAAEQQTQASE